MKNYNTETTYVVFMSTGVDQKQRLSNNDVSDILKVKQESVRNSIVRSYTTKRVELAETVVGCTGMLLEFDGVI